MSPLTTLLFLLAAATTTVWCADAIATNKWFTVTHDSRKCVSPLCGGYFVAAVNQATTVCADGKKAASCYVAEIELAQELGDLDTLLSTGVAQVLFGSIVPRTYASFGALGVLQAQLAWVTSTAATATSTSTSTSSTFFNATAGTINCIAAPCPPFAASKLNTANNNSPVWSVTPAAVAAALTRQGTIVTGKLTKSGTPNSSLKVSQVYTPYPPQICGGRGLQPCPASQFCNVPEANNCGRADGPGVCTTPPALCTKEYKPVCGCNGKTYSNPCLAAAAGVSVDYQGVCGKQVCGAGLTECRNNGYCNFPKTNKCGSVNPTGGVCAVRPEICTMQYQPVCGCDGKTYGNACGAASAGVSVRKNAAC